MSVFQSIILGVLQGIAEFLPVSSSGHLAVAQKLFGLEEVPLLFDVMLHLATLAAVVLYFRKKIGRLFAVLFRWILRKPVQNSSDSSETDLLTGNESLGRKTILAVIFATLVTGTIGVFTGKMIPDLPLKVTCAGFIFTAFLLIFSSVWEKRQKNSVSVDSEKSQGISIRQSLFIGFMQGIGTLPGVSRSGSTIAGALFCGVNREAAGEFSFIVSIPAILGAFILEAKDLGEVGSQIGFLPVLCGCFAAFAWGYLSLAFLMKLIRRGKLEWFALYLIPLGILGLVFF
ncbi:undecaprenyl-diphosphate phosphatase [Treponema sp.]|uniref:undecaprenyl-diphosphate phosphatase n=1 Tax=Treponema sp. TaxID=166 RepID=UPI003890EB13